LVHRRAQLAGQFERRDPTAFVADARLVQIKCA
jgi:hypothetical protein